MLVFRPNGICLAFGYWFGRCKGIDRPFVVMWPLANGKQATRSVDGTKASQAFGGMAVVGVVVVAICVDFCITILTFNYNRKRIMHEIIPFRHDIPATTQMLTQADCKYVYV